MANSFVAPSPSLEENSSPSPSPFGFSFNSSSTQPKNPPSSTGGLFSNSSSPFSSSSNQEGGLFSNKSNSTQFQPNSPSPFSSSFPSTKSTEWKCPSCKSVMNDEKCNNCMISKPAFSSAFTSSQGGLFSSNKPSTSPSSALTPPSSSGFNFSSPSPSSSSATPFSSSASATPFSSSTSGGFSFKSSSTQPSMFGAKPSSPSLSEGKWKCPCCEAINDGDRCKDCMVPKPSTPPSSSSPTPPPTSTNLFPSSTSGGFSFKPSSTQPSMFGAKPSSPSLPEGKWKCPCCEAINDGDKCKDCMVPKPSTSPSSDLTPPSSSGFNFSSSSPSSSSATPFSSSASATPFSSSTSGGFSFKPSSTQQPAFGAKSSSPSLPEGKWKCPCCEAINDGDKCKDCMVPKPSTPPSSSSPTPPPTSTNLFPSSTSGGFSFKPSSTQQPAFGAQSSSPSLPEGKWKCPCCEAINDGDKCKDCMVPKPSTSPSSSPTPPSTSTNLFPSSTSGGFSFKSSSTQQSMFGAKPSSPSLSEGKWKCPCCEAINDGDKCKDCMVPKPSTPPSSSSPTSSPTSTNLFPSSSTGGFSFKPSSTQQSMFGAKSSSPSLPEGKWKCPCCEAINDGDKCKDCMVPKPPTSPSSPSDLTPPSGFNFSSSSGGFSFKPSSTQQSMFGAKPSSLSLPEGKWKCPCCEAINDGDKCKDCMVPKPSTSPSSDLTPPSSSSGFNFSSSSPSSSSATPFSSSASATPFSSSTSGGFSFKPSSTQQPAFGAKPSSPSLPEGKWKCPCCEAINDGDKCKDCMVPKPSTPPSSSSPTPPPTSTNLFPSSTSGGFSFKPSSTQPSMFGAKPSSPSLPEGKWKCPCCEAINDGDKCKDCMVPKPSSAGTFSVKNLSSSPLKPPSTQSTSNQQSGTATLSSSPPSSPSPSLTSSPPSLSSQARTNKLLWNCRNCKQENEGERCSSCSVWWCDSCQAQAGGKKEVEEREGEKEECEFCGAERPSPLLRKRTFSPLPSLSLNQEEYNFEVIPISAVRGRRRERGGEVKRLKDALEESEREREKEKERFERLEKETRRLLMEKRESDEKLSQIQLTCLEALYKSKQLSAENQRLREALSSGQDISLSSSSLRSPSDYQTPFVLFLFFVSLSLLLFFFISPHLLPL